MPGEFHHLEILTLDVPNRRHYLNIPVATTVVTLRLRLRLRLRRSFLPSAPLRMQKLLRRHVSSSRFLQWKIMNTAGPDASYFPCRGCLLPPSSTRFTLRPRISHLWPPSGHFPGCLTPLRHHRFGLAPAPRPSIVPLPRSDAF
jgi:hypothetical protein